MKKFYLLFLIPMFSLISCSKSSPNDDPAFAPVINPEPHYFMTVKGFIDPNLPKNLNLQIITRYVTNNDDCKYVVNDLEGIYRERYRDIILTAQPDSKGNYELKIPIDHLLPGKCLWGIQEMSFLPTSTGFSPILISYFKNAAKLPKNFQYVQQSQLRCDNSFNCTNLGYGQYSIDLPVNHNYIYQIDIHYRRN